MTESVSIIVPAYNEAANIVPVLNEILSAMRSFPSGYEIVVVDDGSLDGTADIARNFARNRNDVRVEKHDRNKGSGRAIWTGLQSSRMDLVIYVPADGQFDSAEIPKFADAAKEADIVLGVRSSRADYSIRRKVQSAVYLWLVNTFFRQKFRDVNWVHLWRREKVAKFEPESFGVFFLQEIIHRAKKTGLRIVEIDSEYRPRKGGKAKGGSVGTVMITLAEAARFYFQKGKD